ncbi:alpha/beta hydrolase fold domain-containing protein, partial [Acinetobacter baumannii]|uniref:alpha/beta hydrolase fold domain-containing protein n=1 Tax=Acinetobacter baumannii TaxID=470 RepID=UPI0013D3CEE0
FVYFPGEAGTLEATLMASYAGYRVLSVDYRLAPAFQYPAALDDVMAVYKAVIETSDPRRVAVFGTSAGGNLTLALMLRAKAEGLALPGAIG